MGSLQMRGKKLAKPAALVNIALLRPRSCPHPTEVRRRRTGLAQLCFWESTLLQYGSSLAVLPRPLQLRGRVGCLQAQHMWDLLKQGREKRETEICSPRSVVSTSSGLQKLFCKRRWGPRLKTESQYTNGKCEPS